MEVATGAARGGGSNRFRDLMFFFFFLAGTLGLVMPSLNAMLLILMILIIDTNAMADLSQNYIFLYNY